MKMVTTKTALLIIFELHIVPNIVPVKILTKCFKKIKKKKKSQFIILAFTKKAKT